MQMKVFRFMGRGETLVNTLSAAGKEGRETAQHKDSKHGFIRLENIFIKTWPTYIYHLLLSKQWLFYKQQ